MTVTITKSIEVGSLRPLEVLFSERQWNELEFQLTSECFSSEPVGHLARHSEL